MGRGKKWGYDERVKLALAWSVVTNNPVQGRYQTATLRGRWFFGQMPPWYYIFV